MTDFNRLKDCVVTNKNVIVRVDINVPIKDQKIQDDTRIRAVIPTIKYLVENKAKVILISHFGRPKGKRNPELSLKPLVSRVSELLDNKCQINFVDDCLGEEVESAVEKANYGEVILLENLRFYQQETENDKDFSRRLASYANLYVNDAFSCSHRSHASIVGISDHLKSCAGLLLESELDNLSNLVNDDKKPMIAIIGGAKVSTKYGLIKHLIKKVDTIVIGGGMANSFLYAQGKNIGKSLCEKDLKDEILQILTQAEKNNCKIIIPEDVVVTKNFENNAKSSIVNVDEVQNDDIIGDIGKKSLKAVGDAVKSHKTVLWNGPLGAFETKPFDNATFGLAKAIAYLTKNGKVLSIAGGGDVVSAINQVEVASDFSYISTAGGAFLEWLEGKDLPGVAALKR